MNSVIMKLPENLRPTKTGPKSDPEIKHLAEQVARLTPGNAVRVAVSGSFGARVLQSRVRHHLKRHLGYHMSSRTDGMGSLYLMKGEKCAS